MTTPLDETGRADLALKAEQQARELRKTLRALQEACPVGPDRVRAAQLRELADGVVAELHEETRAYGWRTVPLEDLLSDAPQ